MVRELLFMIPALCAVMWIAYIAFKKKDAREDVWMLAFFFNLVLTLGTWGLANLGYTNIFSAILNMGAAMFMAPLYLIVVQEKLKIDRAINIWLYFIPAAFIIVSNTVTFLIMGREQGMAYLRYVQYYKFLEPTAPLIWKIKLFVGSPMFRLLFAIQTTFALGCVFLITNRNLRQLSRYLEGDDAVKVKRNIRGVNMTSFMVIFTIIAVSAFTYSDFQDNILLPIGIVSLITMSTYMTGAFLLVHFNPGISTEWAKKPSDFLSPEPAIGPMDVLHLKFEKYMQEKPYTSVDFSLDKVAEDLGTNRTYVSELINKRYGKTFSELVAEKRIAHAVALMEKGNMKMKNVAINSGYQTMSTFYRNFQNVKGISVPTWVKQNGGDTDE